MHHLFQIPNAFLDMDESGTPMRYEDMVAAPPSDMQSSDEIAAFGEQVRERFQRWWDAVSSEDFDRRIEVYFGTTSRHEMLERTVWHSTQHVRQLASLLEQSDIEPDRPLTAADIEGLPLTDKIWDEGLTIHAAGRGGTVFSIRGNVAPPRPVACPDRSAADRIERGRG